jgi:hypothetical protein
MTIKALVTIVVLTVVIIITEGVTTQDPSFSIKFRLLNHESSVDSTNQFCARVIFTNVNHPTIDIEPKIQYGYDGTDPFTVQAFDLNNNEINISSTNADYDWIMTNNFVQFQKGNSISDTICSTEIYHFQVKGTFKLRIIFRPDNLFVNNGKIAEQIIYSNWDTLTIR